MLMESPIYRTIHDPTMTRPAQGKMLNVVEARVGDLQVGRYVLQDSYQITPRLVGIVDECGIEGAIRRVCQDRYEINDLTVPSYGLSLLGSGQMYRHEFNMHSAEISICR
jgi:hypothetical protein